MRPGVRGLLAGEEWLDFGEGWKDRTGVFKHPGLSNRRGSSCFRRPQQRGLSNSIINREADIRRAGSNTGWMALRFPWPGGVQGPGNRPTTAALCLCRER